MIVIGPREVPAALHQPQTSQLTWWDFTYWGTSDYRQIYDLLKTICKRGKAVFQQEAGDEKQGVHMQGRMQLIKKTRLGALVKLLEGTALEGAHLSPTSTPSNHTFDYVMKLQGRLAGPWRLDQPLPPAITKEVEKMIKEGLRPWQQQVVDNCKTYHPREVNVIIDKVTGIGKGCLKAYLETFSIASICPATNCAKELNAHAFKFPAKAYVFDCPKAFFGNPDKELPKGKKRKIKPMDEFWTGIELIKDGWVYEGRYEPKKELRERPVIWVFTNQEPDLSHLSADRWKLWLVSPDDRLIKWTPEREQKTRMVADLRKKPKVDNDPLDWDDLDSVNFENLKQVYC